MQYFEPADDQYQRVGKVIGDVFSAVLVLFFIGMVAHNLFR